MGRFSANDHVRTLVYEEVRAVAERFDYDTPVPRPAVGDEIGVDLPDSFYDGDPFDSVECAADALMDELYVA